MCCCVVDVCTVSIAHWMKKNQTKRWNSFLVPHSFPMKHSVSLDSFVHHVLLHWWCTPNGFEHFPVVWCACYRNVSLKLCSLINHIKFTQRDFDMSPPLPPSYKQIQQTKLMSHQKHPFSIFIWHVHLSELNVSHSIRQFRLKNFWNNIWLSAKRPPL